MTRGEKIRTAREHVGLSQTALADKINVSKQTMYKYESDIITNIPSDKIEAIAQICNCSPEYLMGWNSEPAAPSDVMDIVNQYGTDTPEQRAALSAALDAVDIPAEKRELIQRILRMEPKQVAEVLELLQLADRMRQQ